jgi:hypothetical protein
LSKRRLGRGSFENWRQHRTSPRPDSAAGFLLASPLHSLCQPNYPRVSYGVTLVRSLYPDWSPPPKLNPGHHTNSHWPTDLCPQIISRAVLSSLPVYSQRTRSPPSDQSKRRQVSGARWAIHLFTDSKVALRDAVTRPSKRLSSWELPDGAVKERALKT